MPGWSQCYQELHSSLEAVWAPVRLDCGCISPCLRVKRTGKHAHTVAISLETGQAGVMSAPSRCVRVRTVAHAILASGSMAFRRFSIMLSSKSWKGSALQRVGGNAVPGIAAASPCSVRGIPRWLQLLGRCVFDSSRFRCRFSSRGKRCSEQCLMFEARVAEVDC